MSKVITFSRVFPAYHPKKGQSTNFIEKIYVGLADIIPEFKIPNDANDYWDFNEYYNSEPKFHTIRGGNRFKVGDKFSPRIWSGKPYNSKQIILCPDIEVKKIWDFYMDKEGVFYVNGKQEDVTSSIWDGKTISDNDGLSSDDFLNWFPANGKEFKGQIICWNENINY